MGTDIWYFTLMWSMLPGGEGKNIALELFFLMQINGKDS